VDVSSFLPHRRFLFLKLANPFHGFNVGLMKAILETLKRMDECHAVEVLELLFNHNNQNQNIMSKLSELSGNLNALAASVTAANAKLEAIDTAVKNLQVSLADADLAPEQQAALDALTAAVSTNTTDTATLAADAKVP